MRKLLRNDKGFMTGKAIFGIFIIVFLIYLAASFFPLVNVPFSMDGQIKQMSQNWLRVEPRYRRAPELKQFKDNVKDTITKYLSPDHEFDDKKLVIEAGLNSNKVKVQLPYTIIIRFLGSDLRFEKELLIEETSWTF